MRRYLLLSLMLYVAVPSFHIFANEKSSYTKLIDELKVKLAQIKPSTTDQQQGLLNANHRLNKIRYLNKVYHNRIDDQELHERISTEKAQLDTELKRIKENSQNPILGELEEAYFSVIDNSYQPFLRYLPKTYKHDKKHMLIIYLHGYAPWLNIVNWSYLPAPLKEFADRNSAILLSPFARSNTDFQSVGERDVLKAIENITSRFNVDPDRILLTGISMGGMGVWTIGGHYPDKFAGLLILAGRGDYYVWKEIERDSLPAYKRYLVDMEFGHEFSENFSHQNIFMVHSSNDPTVSVEESRHMRNTLKRSCANLTYKEYQSSNHLISSMTFSDKEVQQWLKKTRRNTVSAFEFKTFHLEWNRSFYAEINRFEEWGKPATLSAKIKKKKGIFKCSNIAEINLKRLFEFFPEVTEFKLNGKQYPADESNALIRLSGRDDKDRLKKTRKVCGPLRHMFLSPFTYIVPDNRKNKGWINCRTHLIYWIKYCKSMPRMVRYTKMTDQLMKGNIFLFGDPGSNPFLRKIVSKLPIEYHSNGFTFNRKKYELNKAGIIFIYPNPLNPQRYVAVASGKIYGAGLSDNHRYDLIPDYIVFSEEQDAEGSNTALDAGFFDNYWQLPKARNKRR